MATFKVFFVIFGPVAYDLSKQFTAFFLYVVICSSPAFDTLMKNLLSPQKLIWTVKLNVSPSFMEAGLIG